MTFPRLHHLTGSLRGRLLLLVAAVMIPAAVLAAALIVQAYRDERDQMVNVAKSTAQELSLLLDSAVREREAMLRGLAVSPDLRAGDLAAFDAQARALEAGLEQWIVLIGPDGRQRVNTYLPYGAPLPSVRFRAEFRAAAEDGRTYVSNLIKGPTSHRFVLVVAIPVMQDGKLQFTLNLATRPERLNAVLLEQRLAPGWTVSIVDREGRIAARSRGATEAVGVQVAPELAAALRQGAGVVENTNWEGEPTLAAYSRSPLTGWSVVIDAPRGQLYAAARRMAGLAVGATSLLGLVAAAMAWWVGRGMVRGVRQLASDADLLAHAGVPGPAGTGMEETDRVAAALRTGAQKLQLREQELRQLNETLEDRVRLRTRELAEANRDLEDFARVASHDLREPLRLISSYAAMLKTECGEQITGEALHCVERIEVAAQRLSALIRDILAYSRTHADGQGFGVVDLDQVLRDVCGDLEMRLKETGGKIEVRGSLGQVRADPAQMHQLLANLLTNSLKFVRPGVPPTVTIETTRRGAAVYLLVQDNGIGFAPEYAERIFAPFERLHSGTRYEGTGIGLAVVRRIVERHGGRVQAASVPGQGSRFEILLPEDAGASG